MRFSRTKWYQGTLENRRFRARGVDGAKPGSCHAALSSVFVDAL